MGPPDYTEQYNTQLDPKSEQMFRNWSARSGKSKDLFDYDVRGAFKAGELAKPGQHGTDRWKKPNHPTFSNESVYHSDKTPGGSWTSDKAGKWSFNASPLNVQMHGADGLKDYFKQVEPDVNLNLGTQ